MDPKLGYVWANASPSKDFVCKWLTLPSGLKVRGIYITLQGNAASTTSTSYIVGYVRKVTFQLDDPVGAAIWQGEILMANNGSMSGKFIIPPQTSALIWNGGINLDLEISEPGTYTLTSQQMPDDLLSQGNLTYGSFQGCALRVIQ